jgi:hypothetical protein
LKTIWSKNIWPTNCLGGSKNIWPTQYLVENNLADTIFGRKTFGRQTALVCLTQFLVKKHLANKLLWWVKKHLADTICDQKQFGRHNIWSKTIWPTQYLIKNSLADTIFGQKTFA